VKSRANWRLLCLKFGVTLKGCSARIFWIGVLLLAFRPQVTHADERILHLSRAGSWPEFGSRVGLHPATSGKYGFLPAEDGLKIVDLTDPKNPELVAEVPGLVRSVAVRDNLVIAAGNYIRTIDISDIRAPRVLSSLEFFELPTSDILLRGDHAFIGSSYNLSIVDISDPSGLAFASKLPVGSYGAATIAAQGNFIFGAGSEGFSIIDTTDPTAPQIVGEYKASGGRSIAVFGNHAYFAAYDENLHVVDISKPAAPQLVRKLPGSFGPIAVSQDHLFATGPHPILFNVFDLADPAAPTPIHSQRASSSAQGLAISGNLAFLSDYSSQFRIIDISTPAAPKMVADFTGGAFSVAYAPPIAYIAEGTSARILNFADPAKPKQIAQITDMAIERIALRGNYLFASGRSSLLTLEGSGLRIFDVSDPATPRGVGFVPAPSMALDLCVDGNIAFYPVYDRMLIVDVADPANPRVLKTLTGG
jgi:hypothetical protein